MDSLQKIKDLSQKTNELQTLIEDFLNLHRAKKNKIANLEKEINHIKQTMNKYLDDLDEIIDQK